MNELLIISFVIIFVWTVILLMMFFIVLKQGRNLAEISGKISFVEDRLEHTGSLIKDEIAGNRYETAKSAKHAREELSHTIKISGDSLLKRMTENAGMQKGQLDSFSRQLLEMTRLNEEKFESMRKGMENRLEILQEENRRKLEQIRFTVDEKLQTTLEKRLGESFKQVSERLEQVYMGLGEMRNLATGVGDLKKVLTNVKTRGTWGEIRLNSILEQILTPDQYSANVATKKNSGDRVEFAIKLPGQGSNHEHCVWLPIDAKFPQEDYQRLIDARDKADRKLAEKSIKNLEARIKHEARLVKEKYIDPPNTTDFAIIFLPVEGLFAEVLGRPGLCDFLQRKYRIVITGPTTLAALLNSLQMGFKTLAVEKRSSEVWELLGVVKTEFNIFGNVLAKTKKKLQEASNTIGKAEIRTRAIERKLREVEEIPKHSTVQEKGRYEKKRQRNNRQEEN